MHQYCWEKINKAAESTHFACPSCPTSDSGKPGYPAPGHFKRHNGPFQFCKLATVCTLFTGQKKPSFVNKLLSAVSEVLLEKTIPTWGTPS